MLGQFGFSGVATMKFIMGAQNWHAGLETAVCVNFSM
jgi:hypothetical protein